ncbi:MAG: ankyrin repeat domain-containing protein [Desulfobacteraceae bacterium]|nr:ankyrin repeat domain-containing protein [Desulfobacteraceae bacterium]
MKNVNEFQQKDDSVSVQDATGATALHYAVEENNVEKAKALVEAGADIDARDVHGRTPIMYSYILDMSDAAYYLMEKGADVKALDQSRRSMLYKAVVYGDYSLAEKLVGLGVNPNTEDVYGYSPLKLASGDIKMTEILEGRQNI